MIYQNIAGKIDKASSIILGCMRMPALNKNEAVDLISHAFGEGINYFDHATIYGNGEAETRFGEAFKDTGLKRDEVIIQSKCGLHIDRQEFDWSKEDIIESVEGSLKRLDMDYLDVLLLHRPDLLFDPAEVAEAFDRLENEGKVRYFGVSNVTPGQLTLLKKYVEQPLVINQLQFSLDQTQLIDGGLYMNNMTTDRSIDRDNGVLDYCRLNDITIQAWSPLQKGMFGGCFIGDPEYKKLNDVLNNLADKYKVKPAAVAIAWILRHPAKIQAIAGTMNKEHLKDICDAASFKLTHHEWYELYLASGKFLP